MEKEVCKLKVLVIWRLLTVGGVNAGWRNRAVYFKKFGINTEFIYVKDLGGMHIMEDVAPVYLPKDTNEIIQIIKQNHYDVIIVCDTKKAYKWLRKAHYSGPLLIEARTPEIIKLTRQLPDFDKITPNKIIVPSHHQRRLASILIDADVSYEVIYNGINTEIFKPIPKDEIHWSALPKLPKNKKIVAYIGRLDGRKNWKLLLKIAQKIKSQRHDIEIWIIGGAMSVQKEEFEIEWKKLNLTDIIKWFPVIPYQEMPHLYAKIKYSKGCTIATTKGESFGNTFIESMACGVPVVAPNISSIPEIVENGKTGFIYKEEDVQDAVEKIYKAIGHRKRYRQLSKNARKRVEKNFSISIVANQYMNLLREVARGKHSNETNQIS